MIYYLLSSNLLLKKSISTYIVKKLASRSNMLKINVNFLAVTNNVEIILKNFTSYTRKYEKGIFFIIVISHWQISHN